MLQRSKPKITEIVEKELDLQNIEPNEEGKKQAKRLIVFVIGGLSVAEIASLQQLEKENACASVVVGSTEILSPVEFLRMLGSKVDLVKPIKRDFNLKMHGQTAI